MRIIPVMIRQPKINLHVKSGPLIFKKLTKSAKISKYPIQLLASPLALRPLARTATFFSQCRSLRLIYKNKTDPLPIQQLRVDLACHLNYRKYILVASPVWTKDKENRQNPSNNLFEFQAGALGIHLVGLVPRMRKQPYFQPGEGTHILGRGKEVMTPFLNIFYSIGSLFYAAIPSDCPTLSAEKIGLSLSHLVTDIFGPKIGQIFHQNVLFNSF